MLGRRGSTLGFSLSWTVLAAPAWADDAKASSPDARAAEADAPAPLPKPEIQFSADELEGDMHVGALSLRGDVVVTYDRFRLTSPELTLSRTARGISVRGWGELVFCPCPDPPVSIGFRGVLVGPPADLLLDRPELRVAGTTLAVLPWFWLRAPTRPGLLPPTVAWRGEDGLLLGAGVHLPWREATPADDAAPSGFDVNGAGYVQGGFEITGQLRTSHSTNRVRWDRLHGDLVAVDAHGSFAAEANGAVAWDVDAVRGSRARSAAPSLEEAARAYDRAAAEAVVRPGAGVLLGIGWRAVAPRGGAGPSARGASGPRATLAAGGAVADVGAWDVLSTFMMLADPWLGPTELGRVEGGIDLAIRPAWWLARLALREAFTAGWTSPDGRAAIQRATDQVAALELEWAAPLARVFEPHQPEDPSAAEPPAVHVIEPRARLSLAAAHTSGAFWSETGSPSTTGGGEVAVVSAGARTSWGRLLSREGGALEADIAEMSATRDAAFAPPATVVRYRTSWSSRYLGWSGEGAVRLFSQRGQVVVGRVRMGEEDGWHLGVKASGRTGIEPLVARTIAPAEEREPSGGWLSDEGWSASAELRARLGRGVAATVGADEDLTSSTILATRASVGYAHPCRCISVDAFAARRLARGGIDVWVSIDLAPR